MTSLRVYNSVIYKTVMNKGRAIEVKIATHTNAWLRVRLAEDVAAKLAKALETADVPTGATTAIMTEKEHPSEADHRTHFTLSYEDENGKYLGTGHVYPEKETESAAE